MMINLTDENFEQEIQETDKPVLVDFWMPSCAPCFLLSPILEKLANDYRGKIIFAKANLENAPLTAQKYGIDMTPTIILFKEGKPIGGFIGARPEGEIRKWLEENLKSNEKDHDPPNSPSSQPTHPKGEIEKIIKEYQEYATKNNFQLNPNREVVERIIKRLLENEKKYGARYCPCRRITGNPEDDKSKICPCAYHRMEIEKNGHCLCGLFVKPVRNEISNGVK
jgi:thioredoxin